MHTAIGVKNKSQWEYMNLGHPIAVCITYTAPWNLHVSTIMHTPVGWRRFIYVMHTAIGWPRFIGFLYNIGHFLQMSLQLLVKLAENDVYHNESCESWAPCRATSVVEDNVLYEACLMCCRRSCVV